MPTFLEMYFHEQRRCSVHLYSPVQKLSWRILFHQMEQADFRCLLNPHLNLRHPWSVEVQQFWEYHSAKDEMIAVQ